MSVKADETAKRLMTIPGIGPVTASAIMAMIQDMGDFASGREFAAFLGLTPRQSSTGGKPRLGRITKMGDRYLRQEELSLQGEAGNRGRQRSEPTAKAWKPDKTPAPLRARRNDGGEEPGGRIIRASGAISSASKDPMIEAQGE